MGYNPQDHRVKHDLAIKQQQPAESLEKDHKDSFYNILLLTQVDVFSNQKSGKKL